MDILEKLQNGDLYLFINHENKPLDFSYLENQEKEGLLHCTYFDFYTTNSVTHVYSSRLLSFIQILNHGSYYQQAERLVRLDCALRLEDQSLQSYTQINFQELYKYFKALMIQRVDANRYELQVAISEDECYNIEIIGVGEFSCDFVKSLPQFSN
jgi:hypothetical protein